ncbi:MAG: class I mannose-6-phosphate isomerase [Anaerolineaceae bacterium]|nr:class I mannose-6-phosphate isomerase [Anaerolineaceae bacterium]
MKSIGKKAHWVDVATILKPEEEINKLVAPYLGGDDPIFGTRCDLRLKDFFVIEELERLSTDPDSDVNIIYGTGASLAGWQGLLLYIDVPKNEIQFRARAGSITNLGIAKPAAPKSMYKRFFFVDWEVLNSHKAELVTQVDWFIDGQRPDEPVFITGENLRDGLSQISRNYFRVRPWFEPGAWGGQWIKEKIPQLPKNVPNYAWSFELIVPENGLIFESSDLQLEASFDLLMYTQYEAVLGNWADTYRYEFPIRMDFLDTFDGGNLSVQVHPRPEFLRKNFGQSYTQDETYYILDCAPDAEVYLGFQENVDKTEFQNALETSQKEKKAIDIKQYVNTVQAHKHDLFLIPHGTIHGSGKNNLVLEISATTYIFTFKLYDWMRLDLDGKPRPINIKRGMKNLYFYRQGKRVEQELVSKPKVIERDSKYQIVHLPTHPAHFYDVHRLEFKGTLDIENNGSCHVMSLVEGDTVILETEGGYQTQFNYAETFVIPAAANKYRLIAPDGKLVKVIKVFFKENWQEDDWLSQIKGVDS